MANYKLKIFVASSFLNKPAARVLGTYLRWHGFIVTSTWADNPPHPTKRQLQIEALQDLSELAQSDVLVVLWPGRWGTLSEIGGALMDYKPVFILGRHVPRRKNVYFYHPRTSFYKSREELLAALKGFERELTG